MTGASQEATKGAGVQGTEALESDSETIPLGLAGNSITVRYNAFWVATGGLVQTYGAAIDQSTATITSGSLV